MGATTSNTDTTFKNEPLDSETIRNNIIKAFRQKQPEVYSEMETLHWSDGGAVFDYRTTNRNRYDEHNPEMLLAQMQGYAKGGAIANPHETSDYYALSDTVLQTWKRHINGQTSTGQDGGGCGCDGSTYSATSPQPIDYSVLRGGAGNSQKETKEEPTKDKKQTKKSNDDDDNEDDDIDEDEDLEVEEDEEFDDDEDTDDDKNIKKKHKQSRIDSSHELDNIIKPFYSSDSDYHTIKHKNGRYV